MNTPQTDVSQAIDLINGLPEGADWQAIAYHVEVRASIERGTADIAAGRTFTTEEVRQRFGIPE